MLKQSASSDSSAAKQIDVFFPVSLTIEHMCEAVDWLGPGKTRMD